MIEQPAVEPIVEDEPAEGTTFALTPEGWQSVEYVEPDQTWLPLEDGSFASPDGLLRTWFIDEPAGDAIPG